MMKRALLITVVTALLLPPAALGASDKTLQRQTGSVSYKDPAGASHAVSGSIVLADDATALTGKRSTALLGLPDSSEVTLGENTSIQVGKFNDATNPNPTTIKVDGGALKFAIRHPAGAKSNYLFTTPTSQIAVRGTEGFLVVGPNGTQVVCTKCEPGDVTVRVAGVITAIVTGQVFTVLGPSGATTTAVGSTSTLNNPAVSQFSNGVNPLGNSVATTDVTGSTSGIGGAASAGVGAGAVVGTAAVGAVAVAAVAQASPAPAAGPTSAPVIIGPSSLIFSQPGQLQIFRTSGPVSITSANPSVATVSGSGTSFMIRAMQAGSTTLIVSAPGYSARVAVTVAASNSPVRPH